VQPLVAFVEKPPLEVARRYVDGGRHLWNSGLFMMKASVWLRALQRLAPAMHAACVAAFKSNATDKDFVRIDKDAFMKCPSDSIDYAVMEKLSSDPELGIAGVVVPLSAGCVRRRRLGRRVGDRGEGRGRQLRPGRCDPRGRARHTSSSPKVDSSRVSASTT